MLLKLRPSLRLAALALRTGARDYYYLALFTCRYLLSLAIKTSCSYRNCEIHMLSIIVSSIEYLAQADFVKNHCYSTLDF